MVADEPPPETVVDQPRIAIRTCQTKAALAAQRQRRITATIEEQQRLLTTFDDVRTASASRGAMKRPRGGPSVRRSIASMPGRCWPPNRSGKWTRLANARGVHWTWVSTDGVADTQHDRHVGAARPYHRHVARVDVLLLLVGRIVLLIDDDQTKVGIRQKQCRARADHHTDFARRRRQPGSRAQPRRKLRVPLRRPRAEPGGEAVEKLRRQRDLGHQHEGLPGCGG